ncbi:hypothetical protein SAMN05216558_2420 [Pseudomonas vancouverensis]|nr:hypothetical protein SAMN05216558_2420 [Pseudomonas vancouverensis]
MGKKRTEITPWDSLPQGMGPSSGLLATEVNFFASLIN